MASAKESKLKVQAGVEQPSSLNQEAIERMRSRKSGGLPVPELVKGILAGDRSTLGRAITLVESAHTGHQDEARDLVAQCLPHAGNSIRIGITGVPGVGKSTFIEAFGTYLTSIGHKVAVLAIDPSSQRSKGSILGDKTRMEKLSSDPNAFIRPSPSAGTLGGVARKTREIITVCEAAGFDVIIVETVGVGQSETTVHGMVDFFLLLMLAGAGDELQGIKRGIMELSDAIVINKADGQNRDRAELARKEFENALHLFPPAPSGWTPVTRTCSAMENSGVEEVWNDVMAYRELTTLNGYFDGHRNEQLQTHFTEAVRALLTESFFNRKDIGERYRKFEKDVADKKVNPYEAARLLLRLYKEEGGE